VKGYTSGINFDAMKWEQPGEAALKVMPLTTGIAKSGAILEPSGDGGIKSDANLAPQSEEK
jgi:hypothetical protein